MLSKHVIKQATCRLHLLWIFINIKSIIGDSGAHLILKLTLTGYPWEININIFVDNTSISLWMDIIICLKLVHNEWIKNVKKKNLALEVSRQTWTRNVFCGSDDVFLDPPLLFRNWSSWAFMSLRALTTSQTFLTRAKTTNFNTCLRDESLGFGVR